MEPSAQHISEQQAASSNFKVYTWGSCCTWMQQIKNENVSNWITNMLWWVHTHTHKWKSAQVQAYKSSFNNRKAKTWNQTPSDPQQKRRTWTSILPVHGFRSFICVPQVHVSVCMCSKPLFKGKTNFLLIWFFTGRLHWGSFPVYKCVEKANTEVHRKCEESASLGYLCVSLTCHPPPPPCPSLTLSRSHSPPLFMYWVS